MTGGHLSSGKKMSGKRPEQFVKSREPGTPTPALFQGGEEKFVTLLIYH
jgi:hypothetical protein